MDFMRDLLRVQNESKRLARLADPFGSLGGAAARDAMHQADRMARIARGSELGLPRSVWSQMEDLAAARRAMQLADRPLMQRRAETICMGELAREVALMPPNYTHSFAEAVGIRQMDLLSDITRSTRLVQPVSDEIHRALQDQTLSRLADLAKPYRSYQEETRRLLDSANVIFDAGKWARQLGIPMIDAASISAIAREWGPDGFLRNLRKLGGIDAETLSMMAAALDAEMDDDADDGDDDGPMGTGRTGATGDAGLSMNMLGIFLMLLIFLYQERSNRAMEARLREDNRALSAQVQQIDERLTQCVDQWAPVAEALIAQAQPPVGVQFVAGPRGAPVRPERANGTVEADVLPGQLVLLVAKDGKWIEISYFDFATGTQRTGWVLKKHFVRVKTARPQD